MARLTGQMRRQWRKYVRDHYYSLQNDDDAFEAAFDIGWRRDVGVARERAYALLEWIGRPYGENLWDGTRPE